MFTSLGVPMLWEGMEFAEPRGWDPDAVKLVLSSGAVRPSADCEKGRRISHGIVSLIRQRITNPALYRGTFHPLAQYTGQKVMVWGFEDTASTAKVMVVANFRGVQHTITSVPWLAPGTWYNIADGSPFVVTGGSIDTMSYRPTRPWCTQRFPTRCSRA